MKYWASTGTMTKMPILSRTALVFFSAPPASSGIERDFGSAGLLITKQRTYLSQEYVEMCMFIYANRDGVNLDQVKQQGPKARFLSS